MIKINLTKTVYILQDMKMLGKIQFGNQSEILNWADTTNPVFKYDIVYDLFRNLFGYMSQ